MGAHVAMDVSEMTEVFGHRNGDGSGYREKKKKKKKEPLLRAAESCCFILSHKVSVSMFSVSSRTRTDLCSLRQLRREAFQRANSSNLASLYRAARSCLFYLDLG